MDVRAPAPAPLLAPGLSVSSAGTSRPIDPARAGEVARGFESMFLSFLLKEMRQTLEPDTFFSGDKGDVLGGLFDQFMAEHLSQKDALGIAAMVRKQLEPTSHTYDRDHRRPPDPAGMRPADPLVF